MTYSTEMTTQYQRAEMLLSVSQSLSICDRNEFYGNIFQALGCSKEVMLFLHWEVKYNYS